MKPRHLITIVLLCSAFQAFAQHPVHSTDPEFLVFWKSFRSAVMNRNIRLVAAKTEFPLVEQSASGGSAESRSTISRDEFEKSAYVTFFDADVVTAFKGMPVPKASRFKFFNKNVRSFTAEWQSFSDGDVDPDAPPGATRRISCNLTWLYVDENAGSLDRQFKFAYVGGTFVLYKITRWGD